MSVFARIGLEMGLERIDETEGKRWTKRNGRDSLPLPAASRLGHDAVDVNEKPGPVP